MTQMEKVKRFMLQFARDVLRQSKIMNVGYDYADMLQFARDVLRQREMLVKDASICPVAICAGCAEAKVGLPGL